MAPPPSTRARYQLSCILLLLAAPPLHAQSFCELVTAETLVSPIVLGNGTPGSVTTADIQNALNTGGHIRFDVGASPTTITLASTLVVDRAVVLDGGGVVTLSGGGARRIVEITNTQNQVYAVTLQRISFAFGSTPAARGAAIFKPSGVPGAGPWQAVSLKLVDCDFHDNAAMASGQDDGGGALYATGMDHVRIGNCSFTNNSGSNGGAVYSLGSRRVTIVDSVFSGNQATGTGANPGNGGNAGALGIDGADRQVDVCRTRFVGNTSNAHGAGFFSVMYDATSHSRFEDVTFEANQQLSSTQHTGGAYVQGGPFAFERATFLGNEARQFGGLFVGPGASGTIRNATFVGNVAREGLGAAIAVDESAPVSIVNTTIANNVSTAAFAAGISVGAMNQLRLTNVILANNTGGNPFVNWNIQNAASQDGGGNMQWPASRPSGGGAETPATPTTVFADPLLVPTIGHRGGWVPTLALTSLSPARNSAVTTGEVPATDARGVARVGGPDRGAFEFDPPIAIVDFDADARTDITVYHEASGTWYSRQSSTGATWSFGFGGSGFEPVSGDYDGDAQADLAVYHAASGLWYVRQSTTGTTFDIGFGGSAYTPVPGDYDGDGRTDIAVYHQASGLWFVRQSSTGTAWSYGFGGPAFDPVAGDYDGDGRTDLSVYHAPSGLWYVRRSTTSASFSIAFGGSGFTPVPRDYDGDSRIDHAVYHEPTGLWYVRQSTTDTTTSAGYGGPGFAAVPADYDGDGRADFAVYHSASGLWYVRQSATGTTFTLGFGGSGFAPVNP